MMNSRNATPAAGHSPTRRILMVRLSAHGDVVHALPLLAAIKRADPAVFVGWLVEAAAAPLLEGHPLIDCLHVSHRKRWLKDLRNPLRWAGVWSEVRSLLQALRANGYTVSLDVQGLLKSALCPWLAGIPQRYGYARTRENAALFYNRKLPPMNIRDASVPAVERTLDFARALGYAATTPEFVLPPVAETSREKIALLLAGFASERPLAVLAPFTRWASKHWVDAFWTALAAQLLAEGWNLAVVGSPADAERADAILRALPPEAQPFVNAEDCRVLNLAGRTNWPDLPALYARARVLIGLDSAPLHIANAAGLPVVGIYGPTAPGRTGPVGERQVTVTTALSCQPCFEHACPLKGAQHWACMRELSPERVMAAVQQLLPGAVAS